MLYFHRKVDSTRINSKSEEIKCIHALVVFIGRIAEYDEFCRIKFCRNSEWDVLRILTAYATCSIDTVMKCDIFFTLTALGKSPETSKRLLTIFAENNVLSIITTEHKFFERGIKNKTCPLIDAIFIFMSTIQIAKIERAQEVNSFFKFVIETVLLTSYDR